VLVVGAGAGGLVVAVCVADGINVGLGDSVMVG